MPRRIRVVLVDDHIRPRHALRAFLDTQPNVEVIGEAASGLEAVTLVARLRPDAVVMDVEMPELDGIAATREIAARCPGVAVVGTSMYPRRREEMLAAGACAFVAKFEPPEKLIEALHAAASHV